MERYCFFCKVYFFTKNAALRYGSAIFEEFYMCELPMTHLLFDMWVMCRLETCCLCGLYTVEREKQDYHYWPGAALTLTVIKIGFQMSYETVYLYKLSQ